MRRRHYSVLGMHNYACVYLVSVLLTFKHSMHGDKLVVGTPPHTRKVACLESLFGEFFGQKTRKMASFFAWENLRKCKSKHKKLMQVSWRVQVAPHCNCGHHTVIRNSWQRRQNLTDFVHRASATLGAIQTYERGMCKYVRAVTALCASREWCEVEG